MATIAKQLDILRSQLLTSGLQTKDTPLWQVIDQLIGAVRIGFSEIETSLNPGGGGGPAVPLANLDYVTHENDKAQLPNSRRIIAGSGATLLKQVDNLVVGGVVPPSDYAEEGPMGFSIPGIQGIQGIQGLQGIPGLDAYCEGIESPYPPPSAIEEVGLWTPVIGGSGGESGQVYSLQFGIYVRTKNRIHASYRAQLSTLGTVTTATQIKGLPYPSVNQTNYRATSVIFWINTTTAYSLIQGVLTGNSTAIGLFANVAPTTNMAGLIVQQADLSNTTLFTGSIDYQI